MAEPARAGRRRHRGGRVGSRDPRPERLGVTSHEAIRHYRGDVPARPRPRARPRGVTLSRVLYPGSFDPIHNGHIEIVEAAVNLFGTVVVAVISNPQKTTGL